MELNEFFYQHYWWLLIAVLGALLVFLLFVQGGQTLISTIGKKPIEKTMLVNSLGRKWEFTFTTLVVFGGAFFASFPLFYSTSFGGAYWLWMAILFSFIIQAVSYEYRSKKGNFLGTKVYDAFLVINGFVGIILLGVAVATFFNGADFKVDKENLLNVGMPVISTWQNPTHGLEAIIDWRNLLLGVAVFFLARVQASLYFINNIDDPIIYSRCRKQVLYNAVPFLIFFLAFVGVLLTKTGYEFASSTESTIYVRPFKYFFNLIEMPWVLGLFLIGVVGVLYAIIRSYFGKGQWKYGIWFSGIGTVLVVLSLFFLAGYNNTPYYPSATDMQSSLTIYNSSSSLFTLQVMSVVSLLIPFVLAYIFYAWRAMDRKPITEQEMESGDHKY
ncbi:cytochrome d ubiquinol oxidase subunit II [Coprobacter tertius]|uniref:Cytochrome d ubiquinol oxidase subunit II n=1 Tax=Coprobacter tertius TaxID=2944915 RepID=A0ABT1MEZ5_9BACT|nr:cytochrome d ubiquinol oxidase subunit II [Coprobacter tertius]MCP9611205.1 cytochrome d ubiquinol oxidase subunit II [Coprobacter tertius]